MSERTAPSIAKLDVLLPLLKTMPALPEQASLVEEAEALRRAVSAFHMEAIRFRMHNVERLLKLGAPAPALEAFEDLRHTLEAAGFHTRSHAAP